jgi:hypothetical protein
MEILFLSIFLANIAICIATISNPLLHTVLRNSTVYSLVFIFSVILFLITVINFNRLTIDERKFSFMSLSLIIFLILYKFFDRIIIKKHNRHFHFVGLNKVVIDLHYDVNERENTKLENFFQFILFAIPLFFTAFGYIIF